MIRISERDFDWSVIDEIYEKSGELVKDVCARMEGKTAWRSRLTGPILQAWFFDETQASGDKVHAFLLSRAPAEWIERYAKTVCGALWKSESGSVSQALLRYKAIAEQAAKETAPDRRLELISEVVTEEHIARNMFEVRDQLGKPKNGRPEYRALTPDDLRKPVKRGSLCASPDRLLSIRTTRQAEIEDFLADCKEIFSYDDFSEKYRDDLLHAMRVNVCPYCNRQYISSWQTEAETRSTADIDHFYNKDRFPFLALSLYNFVPSCQICNSRFKLTRDFYATPHFNPHDPTPCGDAWFEIDNIKSVIQNNEEVKFSIHTAPDVEAAKHSVETFHLQELYQDHRDYVKELIKKSRMFSETQINEYYANYVGAKSRLFSSKEELYRAIYGNYLKEKDLGKRPLAKLTRDILLDLGVINQEIEDQSETP